MRPIITESAFAEYGRCPLRGPRPEVPVEELALATTKWLLTRHFNGVAPSLREIRAEYERLCAGTDYADAVIHRRAVTSAPRLTRRMHQLVDGYKVLCPVVPYTLDFGRNSACGEYAILRRQRSPENLILRVRYGTKKSVEARRGPDLINLLRWSHMRTWQPELSQVAVLNWSLDNEDGWTETFSDSARLHLNAIAVNIVERRLWPASGAQCQDCPAPGCKGGRQDGGSHDDLQPADRIGKDRDPRR